jgi:hypothetical protein
MSTQFFLDENDIESLMNLLLRSQQSRTREALCLRIGIDPRRLGFITNSADADFVLQLITYLNEINNKEALCKLCCQELIPIFSKSEKHELILSEIAAKLHCDQVLTQKKPNNEQPAFSPSIPAYRVSVNPFNQLIKNKLITGGTTLLIGLAGFTLSALWLPDIWPSARTQVNVKAESDAQAVELGGINMNKHCASIGFERDELIMDSALGWRCRASDGRLVSIDVDDACQRQYNNPRAKGRSKNHNDRNSWVCVEE